jgi:hypothetical protein
MKRLLTVFSAVILVLAGTAFSSFAGAAESLPADIVGTPYEAAVKMLIEKGIVSGYEDGTFRPEAALTRAEACIMTVKAAGTPAADIKAAERSDFGDLSGYGWAGPYIGYAAERGIVKGYEDGSFQPGNSVTYNELCAMLVNASGDQPPDPSENWPENYLNKARESGIIDAVTAGPAADQDSFDTNRPATRGNAALMVEAALNHMRGGGDGNDGKDPNEAEDTGGSAVPSDEETDTAGPGKLAGYTGIAYGMIQDFSTVVNEEGESVQQIEFLIGKDTVYINTDEKSLITNPAFDGSLSCLKMKKGIVNDVSTDGTALRAKRFAELTRGWTEVAGRDERVITAAGTGDKVTVMKDAVFYTAEFDGDSIDEYKPGTLSGITAGSVIRAYDVTDDDSDNADIVVIVKLKDKLKII